MLAKYLSEAELREMISKFTIKEEGYLTTKQVEVLYSSSNSRINRMTLWKIGNATLPSIEKIWPFWKYRLFLIDDVIRYYLENKHMFFTSRTEREEVDFSELERLSEAVTEPQKGESPYKAGEEPNKEETTESKNQQTSGNGSNQSDYINYLKDEVQYYRSLVESKDVEITRLHNESKTILMVKDQVETKYTLLKSNVRFLAEWKIKPKEMIKNLREQGEELEIIDDNSLNVRGKRGFFEKVFWRGK